MEHSEINTAKDDVWVKLTKRGEEIMTKNLSETKRPTEKFKWQIEAEENDGFVRFKFFYLMEIFGSSLRGNPFEGNKIYLSKPLIAGV